MYIYTYVLLISQWILPADPTGTRAFAFPGDND